MVPKLIICLVFFKDISCLWCRPSRYINCGQMVVISSLTHASNNMQNERGQLVLGSFPELSALAPLPFSVGFKVLWRCHIAPAKPNGPIPFDLNDKR